MNGEHTDFENMSVFEQIRSGLRDGIAQAKGDLSLRTATLPAPAPALTKTQVVRIRRRLSMTQAVFAQYLNVPKKTLQSWEQGARAPKASEARLLQIIDKAPEEVLELITSQPRSE